MARVERSRPSAEARGLDDAQSAPTGQAGVHTPAEELADDLRTRAFHLMDEHPIAAAHLVLAAASIAPECAAKKEVADEFSFVIANFTQQLKILHHRAVTTRAIITGAARHGA
ncbi:MULTISPECIES: hypothetical protein [Sphingomonas]|uniref:hypothetical protein n=1 Tax=Sphingomonas TaxID=13687 RepID=UPI00254A4663|nr:MULTISPECIES: hypothetical protein [Sphingomonas]MDK8187121.1 hypothetical protein [Sphingomonas zeae]MDK8216490.1 hypothetical protein [Sphingomonas sp. UMB7805-LC452B]